MRTNKFIDQFYYKVVQDFKNLNNEYKLSSEYSGLDNSSKYTVDKIIELQLFFLAKLEEINVPVNEFLMGHGLLKLILKSQNFIELKDHTASIAEQCRVSKTLATLEEFVKLSKSSTYNHNNFNEGVPEQLSQLHRTLEEAKGYEQQLSIINSFASKEENFLAQNYLDVHAENIHTPLDLFVSTVGQTFLTLSKILISPDSRDQENIGELFSPWVYGDLKSLGELYLPSLENFYESFKEIDRANLNIISIGCDKVGIQQVYPWVYNHAQKNPESKIMIDLFDNYIDKEKPDFINESNRSKWIYHSVDVSYKYSVDNIEVSIRPSFPLHWGSKIIAESFRPFFEALVINHLQQGNNVIVSQHTGGSVIDNFFVSVYNSVKANVQDSMSKFIIFSQNKGWGSVEFNPDNSSCNSEGFVYHENDAPLLLGVPSLD